MLVNEFRKAVDYTKEIQDLGLFVVMADSRLFAAFGASPLFYIVLPFIGFLLTVSAVINAYQLAKASNKNFDHWLNFIVSLICAALASVSLYGAALSVLIGFAFPMGPWFFFASALTAFTHQAVCMGLNLYRAFESPHNSIQRMHYLQAALNNLFIVGLLAAVLGAVSLVMLSPAAPLIGSACAIAAAGFLLASIIWRIIPHNGKQWIKGKLNLGKPEIIELKRPDLIEEVALTESNVPERHHPRLFSHCDYSAEVRRFDVDSARDYLRLTISNKIIALDWSRPRNEKIEDKIAMLYRLLKAVNDQKEPSKEKLLAKYPLAFQSFWADKGEVEQLFDATVVFQRRYKESMGTEHCTSLPLS